MNPNMAKVCNHPYNTYSIEYIRRNVQSQTIVK